MGGVPCYTSIVGRASAHDTPQTREAIKTKEIPPRFKPWRKGVIIMQVIYTSYGCKVGHNPTEYATDEEALEALEIEQDSEPED